MRSETGRGAGFQASASATGALAGLVALVLLGTVLALILYRYPISADAANWTIFGTRILAYVVAGLVAGRSAGDSGMLHGAVAGLLQLILALAIALLVQEGWPATSVLLSQLALALAAGGLGGIVGVNLGY